MAGHALDPIDHIVRARIRERREALGLSQGFVANVIGVSDSEISKIERGKNRLTAGRLFKIAKCLQTDLYFFFEPAFPTLTGPDPGFSEDAGDWVPRSNLLELVGRLSSVLREIPSDTRPELFKTITEFVRRLATRDGDA